MRFLAKFFGKQMKPLFSVFVYSFCNLPIIKLEGKIKINKTYPSPMGIEVLPLNMPAIC